MITIQNQTSLTNFLIFDCTAPSIAPRTKKTILFRYHHRQGTKFDIHSPWRRIEVPADESRTDIAKAYRLGKWFE